MLLPCLYKVLRQVGGSNRIVLVMFTGIDASSTDVGRKSTGSGQVDHGAHRNDHAKQDQGRRSHHGSEPQPVGVTPPFDQGPSVDQSQTDHREGGGKTTEKAARRARPRPARPSPTAPTTSAAYSAVRRKVLSPP